MQTYSGFIAIIGRPNVGKSSLLNKCLGQKISITSRKPQTTRHKILGVKTRDNYQYIFVDTPGFHHQIHNELSRVMNKSVKSTLNDVDLNVFVVDSFKWSSDDDFLLEKIKKSSIPAIALINKTDKVKDKTKLLPIIERLQSLDVFEHIIPISAKNGDNIARFEDVVQKYLPEGTFLFDPSYVTDKPMRFIVAELIREKVFRLCGQELPYSVSVEIEQYVEEPELVTISALILVDKPSHKRMIIGNKGDKLKQIGSAARHDIERLLENKVFLRTWIKVKSGWSDDANALRQLGYDT